MVARQRTADRSAAKGRAHIKIALENSDQSWHLLQALRGHCDVEVVPGTDNKLLEIVEEPTSDHTSVLRRLDGWQREFGVGSISIELDGRDYVMVRPLAHSR